MHWRLSALPRGVRAARGICVLQDGRRPQKAQGQYRLPQPDDRRQHRGLPRIRSAGHTILPKEDTDFESAAYRKTCLRFFKLICATSLGKICVSDHAMNAVDEMSALDRDLKRFFEEVGADDPVWQALEREAGKYLQ